ncbi:MAG: helix-turn-helix domain-containing protein [Mobilicoccus sp.]|nr:helix-turn-helix domain-containing protein [Mobilicoccus sp.]
MAHDGLEDLRHPPDLPEDTRGILHPRDMLRRVTFERWQVDDLGGLLDHAWCVQWGSSGVQPVLPFPAVNISLGGGSRQAPEEVRAYVSGVFTSVDERVLRGSSRNVAVRSAIGGFGAWVKDVRALAGADHELTDVLGVEVDAPAWHDKPAPETAQLLVSVLAAALDQSPATRVAEAREVASWVRVVEGDVSLRGVERWAAAVGVTPRTLQRAFARCAGVSPMWVVRRFRLLEAIERARMGEGIAWAQVAAELGYADQAHLTRDVTATIGLSPAAYAARQRG